MMTNKIISGLSLLCASLASMSVLAEGPARWQNQAGADARAATSVGSVGVGGAQAVGESARSKTMLPEREQSRPAAAKAIPKAIQQPAASGGQMPALGLCDGS